MVFGLSSKKRSNRNDTGRKSPNNTKPTTTQTITGHFFEKNIKEVYSLSFLHEWVTDIESRGLQVEGIYRKSATSSNLKELSDAYDSARPVDLSQYSVITVSCVLKKYLRSLQEAVTTSEYYEAFLYTTQLSPDEDRLETTKDVLNALPPVNYLVLRYIVGHLCRVADHSEINKMHANNLSVIFGPVLFYKAGVETNPMEYMQHISKLIDCVKYFIMNFEEVFDITVEQSKKLPPRSYTSQWREMFLHPDTFQMQVEEDDEPEDIPNGANVPPDAATPESNIPQPATFNGNDSPQSNGQQLENNSNGVAALQRSSINSQKRSSIGSHKRSSISSQKRSSIGSQKRSSLSSSSQKRSSIGSQKRSSLGSRSSPRSSQSSLKRFSRGSQGLSHLDFTKQRKSMPTIMVSPEAIDGVERAAGPESPPPNDPPFTEDSHRFRIVSQENSPKSPKKESSFSFDQSLTPEHTFDTKNLTLGPQRGMQSYTRFAHMLTTDPNVLSILYHSEFSQIPSLANYLLVISETLGSTHTMLEYLFKFEFESLVHSETNLSSESASILRSNTLLTKILDKIILHNGSTFLAKILKKSISVVIDNSNVKISLNPKDVKAKDKIQKSSILEKNRQRLSSLVEMFSRSIFNEKTIGKLPPDLHYVASIIKSYCKEYDQPVYRNMGSFLILRAINPVIVTPSLCKIYPNSGENVTLEQQQTLVMIAKVIQKIANDVHFHKSEVYMQPMNPIIDKYKDVCKRIMENVSMSDSEFTSYKKSHDDKIQSCMNQDAFSENLEMIDFCKQIFALLLSKEETALQSVPKSQINSFNHVLSLLPGSLRQYDEEAQVVPTRKSVASKSHRMTAGASFRHSVFVPKYDEISLLPESSIKIDLTRPLESVSARIEDCRQQQGISGTPDILTMTNLQLVLEKQLLKRELYQFDRDFEIEFGRAPQRLEKEVLRPFYTRYKQVRMVMASKGLSYSKEEFDKIAEISQMKEPIQEYEITTDGRKRSKYSLNQLVPDEKARQILKQSEEYNRTRLFKREVQKLLHEYQEFFLKKYERRMTSRQDREPMKRYYDIYKYLKIKIYNLAKEASTR